MSNTPVTTSFIFVDRRKTGRGKSINNRQKLLRRIKGAIKQANPMDIDSGGVTKTGTGASSKALTNPVRITRKALAEPTIHYAPSTGVRDVILIGNDVWERGDEFPVSGKSRGKGGNNAGNGEDGEDDFIVNISRDEFLEVFFEDCELPDLRETHEKDLPEAVQKPAGFQKNGSPGQLSVIRSFKNSLGRRVALTSSSREELRTLEEEYQALMCGELTDDVQSRLSVIEGLMIDLRNKINTVGLFEEVDLRYRKTDHVQVKSADAVFLMIMDVSGSMDEDKKRIARKFFSLQYAFIKRKYPNTDLVFIAHTTEPYEMSEEEFFSTRINGGTIVSPAYTLAHKIIKERYDATQTNIYVSGASDGDNWEEDNQVVISEIQESGFLTKLRYMVYAQVGQQYGGYGTNLLPTMQTIANENKKVKCLKIESEGEVFSAFKSVYGKR
jgi:uncharacterized protein